MKSVEIYQCRYIRKSVLEDNYKWSHQNYNYSIALRSHTNTLNYYIVLFFFYKCISHCTKDSKNNNVLRNKYVLLNRRQ